MEFKLYRCSHCGNVAFKLVNSGVPMVCCGEPMQELIPNTTDAAVEKHVPVITRDGDKISVQGGSVIHPMLENHYIQAIAAVSGETVTIGLLKPGESPVLKTAAGDKVTAYSLCNLHGLWKGE